MSIRNLLSVFFLLTQLPAAAQTPFAPLEAWKLAILNGDDGALAKIYSTNPEAITIAGKQRVPVKEERAFWTSLKSAGLKELNPRVLEMAKTPGDTRLLLRISATLGNATDNIISMQQEWAQQSDGWRLIASRRSLKLAAEPPRRLPQPVTPNVNLYPEPQEAQAELKSAQAQAGKEHKRVLLIFGGNWCYDCHVLDTTLHSKDFAPLVEASYVVVHINIGDEGKDNNDLATRVGVNLDKGVPSLAVMEADGKVIFAQTNGEFESTIKIGPEDVRAFLKKWRT